MLHRHGRPRDGSRAANFFKCIAISEGEGAGRRAPERVRVRSRDWVAPGFGTFFLLFHTVILRPTRSRGHSFSGWVYPLFRNQSAALTNVRFVFPFSTCLN